MLKTVLGDVCLLITLKHIIPNVWSVVESAVFLDRRGPPVAMQREEEQLRKVCWYPVGTVIARRGPNLISNNPPARKRGAGLNGRGFLQQRNERKQTGPIRQWVIGLTLARFGYDKQYMRAKPADLALHSGIRASFAWNPAAAKDGACGKPAL